MNASREQFYASTLALILVQIHDYPIIQAACHAVSQIADRLVRFLRHIEILVHGDFKVQELDPLRIGNTCDVDVCAGQRRRDATHIEKQKSRLRAVRLDRLGCELRRLDLIHFLLADRALHFVRKGNRQRAGPRAGLRIRKPPVQIGGRYGSELRVIRCDELNFHVRDGNWLVAVIRDDKKNRQQAVCRKIYRKDLRLFGRVVRVGGERDLFVSMEIVSRIIDGGLRHWLDEVFTG
jgi:hypothetical protein